MLEYCLGSQTLALTDSVLQHFSEQRQTRWYQREAGGQLFASFDNEVIQVVVATGPRKTDRRRRTSFVPDREAEQNEIEAMYQNGLHYVGDWHTHPTPHPSPSHIDLRNIRECVMRSTHDLNGFIHIIVGIADAPDGLYVLYCTSTETQRMSIRFGARLR